MSIEAIGFLPPTTPFAPSSPLAPPDGLWSEVISAPATRGASDFGKWFTAQMQKVNGEIEVADRQLQALATGEAQNLHQVMISLEEARLSFQTLMQVRNRVLEAYQDVMRMQV
jgi:flagellar hook-basal body complex protein FliE